MQAAHALGPQALMKPQGRSGGRRGEGGGGDAKVVRVAAAHLDGGVHDEAGDMHRASLPHPVGSPHCLLQDGRIHAGLQQEHVISCRLA